MAVQTLQHLAQEGRLPAEVLDVDSLPAPPALRALIEDCLSVHPEQRPPATAVVAALDAIAATLDVESDAESDGESAGEAAGEAARA